MVYRKRTRRKFIKKTGRRRRFKKSYKRKSYRKKSFVNRNFKAAAARVPASTKGLFGRTHNVCLTHVYRERYYNAAGGNTPALNANAPFRGAYWTEMFCGHPVKPRVLHIQGATNDCCGDYPFYAAVYQVERTNAMKVTVEIDAMTGANWKGVKVYLIPGGKGDIFQTAVYGSDPRWDFPPELFDIEKRALYKKIVVTKDVASLKKISLTLKPRDLMIAYDKRDEGAFRRTGSEDIVNSTMTVQVLIVPIDYESQYASAYQPWMVDVKVTTKLYMTFSARRQMDTDIDAVAVPTDRTQPTVVLNTGEQDNIFSSKKMDMKIEQE